MTIGPDKLALAEKVGAYLTKLSDDDIDQLVEKGDVLGDSNFLPQAEHPFGQFYAPFDWVNESADIVLIGITPGRRQAKTALRTLREELRKGTAGSAAARAAKQAASFEGEMRSIAAELMDRFQLHRVFGMRTCGELFGAAQERAHYTSLLRYPVLHWQTKKKTTGAVSGWFDYSGGDDAFENRMLVRSMEQDFVREIDIFRNAWLVPFGPVPARALEDLARRKLVDRSRVLSGINHPSGTQRNRHNCQLNTTNDHSTCAPNVGCSTIRERSMRLERIVAGKLGGNPTMTSSYGVLR